MAGMLASEVRTETGVISNLRIDSVDWFARSQEPTETTVTLEQERITAC
jgi:hypothetical protein